MSEFKRDGGGHEVEREQARFVVEHTPTDTRQVRVDRLNAVVAEIFPGPELRELRENIQRSFNVPQVGDYHNEGMFMDSHLDLILRNIEDVANGEFPQEISPAIREALTRAVRRDPESVKKYVFLHDISKADCLTVKFGEEERALTWDEWQSLLAASDNGRKAQTGDGQALRDFCAEQGITGVSYFQKTEDGTRQHGKTGAEELRGTGLEQDVAMLTAIEAHEVAYSFQGIKVATYEKHFGDMDDDTRDFALLASYVDTMASLRQDGKPDLTNFLALAGSREKSESLTLLQMQLDGVKLDRQKFDRAWAALRNSSEPLTADMLAQVESKLRAECKLASYNIEKLRVAIEPLVADGTLTVEERDRLLEVAGTDPQGIGRVFGSKMRFLGSALKQALFS